MFNDIIQVDVAINRLQIAGEYDAKTFVALDFLLLDIGSPKEMAMNEFLNLIHQADINSHREEIEASIRAQSIPFNSNP